MFPGKWYVDATDDEPIRRLRGCQPGSPDWPVASGELRRRALQNLANDSSQSENFPLMLGRLTWAVAVPTVLNAFLTILLALVTYGMQS